MTDLESHVVELRADNLAQRKVIARQASDLDGCRTESVKQPLVWRAAERDHQDGGLSAATRKDKPSPPLQHAHAFRRRTLATPAPTPLTAIPTPFTPIPTTATPSVTPSASPVLTTTAITTYSQLDNAVADTANSEIVIAAPFAFPSQAPITVGVDRTVDRGKLGGRRRSCGVGRCGPLAPILVKDGGSLSLSYLDLANATALGDISSGGIGNYDDCWGTTILVTSGGTLTVSSCLIRGGGPGESALYRTAFADAGVSVADPGANVEFYVANFQHLRGTYGAAFGNWYCSEDLPCQAIFRSCRFEKNVGLIAGAVYIGFSYVLAYFYDTTFARNDAIALLWVYHKAGAIERSNFIENTGSQASWPGVGGAGLVATRPGELNLRGCLFERNVGADGYSGGAASATASRSTWRNVSFISNYGNSGAILSADNRASVALIDCSARSNHGSAEGAGFGVDNAELHVFNSTVAETTGNSYKAFIFYGKSIVSFHNATIRDSFASAQLFGFGGGSNGSFTDCRLLITECSYNLA